MPVVELLPRSSPVGVVDAVDATALGIMQREAVFDSVRAFSARIYLAGFELHGVAFGEPEHSRGGSRALRARGPDRRHIIPAHPLHHIMM